MLVTDKLSLPRRMGKVVTSYPFASPGTIFARMLRDVCRLPTFPVVRVTSTMGGERTKCKLSRYGSTHRIEGTGIPILLVRKSTSAFIPYDVSRRVCGGYGSPGRGLVVRKTKRYRDCCGSESTCRKTVSSFVKKVVR